MAIIPRTTCERPVIAFRRNHLTGEYEPVWVTARMSGYRALDGNIYSCLEACESANLVLRCLHPEKDVLDAWDRVPKIVFDAGDMVPYSSAKGTAFLVVCRDQDDVDAVNCYIETTMDLNDEEEWYEMTSAHIGKRCIVFITDLGAVSHFFGTSAHFCGEIKRIIGNLQYIENQPVPEENCSLLDAVVEAAGLRP